MWWRRGQKTLGFIIWGAHISKAKLMAIDSSVVRTFLLTSPHWAHINGVLKVFYQCYQGNFSTCRRTMWSFSASEKTFSSDRSDFCFFSALPGAEVNCFCFNQNVSLSNISNSHCVKIHLKLGISVLSKHHTLEHTQRLTFLVHLHQIICLQWRQKSHACLIRSLIRVKKLERCLCSLKISMTIHQTHTKKDGRDHSSYMNTFLLQ